MADTVKMNRLEFIVHWCIYPDCPKTKLGNGAWEDDNHRKTQVEAGAVPSQFGYCEEHNPKPQPRRAA